MRSAVIMGLVRLETANPMITAAGTR